MFEITKNGLFRDSLFKALKLENEMYKVTIFYEGDYKSDFENGCIDREMITVACKLKEEGFDLDFTLEDIFVSLLYPPTYSLSEIDDVKRQLEVAKESAEELKGIIKEYFNIELKCG